MFLLISLKENPKQWINLWNWFYKIRLRNSDNNKWKSWWYRTITYYENEDTLILLTIYSKSEQESISDSKIKEILDSFLIKKNCMKNKINK